MELGNNQTTDDFKQEGSLLDVEETTQEGLSSYDRLPSAFVTVRGENDKIENRMRVIDFVKLYLKTLKITQKDLANIFEMRDTNLYKYLIGDRKLNNDLVLKLSYFSHTRPEIWYYLQTKNDLNELSKETEKVKKYEKYDYQKTVLAKSMR